MHAHATWVDVDLDAIRANTRSLLRLAGGARLMAVVKANAYGHGAAHVSRAAEQAGAHWLGVARADEGVALRQVGLGLPILVLGHTPPAAAAEALGHGLSLTVVDEQAAHACAAAGRASGRPARVHVKMDSGMGRLGLAPHEVIDFVRSLRALSGLEVEGILTHFAAADSADPSLTHRQVETFNQVLQSLDAAGLRPPLAHAANSPGIIAYPAAHFDLVRSGIALYGLHPSDDVLCPPGFAPALSWKARVAQVKRLPAGHGVSYGPEYTTRAEETVAVLPVGYADGFRRVPKNVNQVLIGGQAVPILGRVCMDQVVAGISGAGKVSSGDEVVLLGQQGAASISAEELARRWGTINYDVVSGIMARVPREYSGL